MGSRVNVHAFCFFLLLICVTVKAQDCDDLKAYKHPIAFNPALYHASKINAELVIDGKLDEQEWLDAESSEDFVDIEGELREMPERRTMVKMLYDDEYLYIGAHMIEDHIWYSLTEKDAIIYRDDDFEIFIDADGNGHNYHEFEFNANNTMLDLWMLVPYSISQRPHYIIEWDAKGVKSATYLSGTVNDPSDIDSFWSIEIAIPLRTVGGKRDFWRIDFSRVDWLMDVIDGKYVKQKKQPERNWVWSPTGYIDMHKPETWGYVAFDPEFEIGEEELFKWEMWKIYYSVRAFKRKKGYYPEDIVCLTSDSRIRISVSEYGFDLIGQFGEHTWTIDKYALIRRNK